MERDSRHVRIFSKGKSPSEITSLNLALLTPLEDRPRRSSHLCASPCIRQSRPHHSLPPHHGAKAPLRMDSTYHLRNRVWIQHSNYLRPDLRLQSYRARMGRLHHNRILR